MDTSTLLYLGAVLLLGFLLGVLPQLLPALLGLAKVGAKQVQDVYGKDDILATLANRAVAAAEKAVADSADENEARKQYALISLHALAEHYGLDVDEEVFDVYLEQAVKRMKDDALGVLDWARSVAPVNLPKSE